MTMARFQRSATDDAGNVIAGAHVEVRREIPGQPLAALYSNRAGTAGLGNPFDADGEGFFYFHVVGGAYQIRAYTGLSVSPDSEAIWRYVAIGKNAEGDGINERAQRIVTAAGAVTADPDDEILIIKKIVGAATTITVDWSARTKSLTVVDGKGDANTNNLTIMPVTGQTQYSVVNQPVIIDGNGGSVTLTPLTDGTGAF